MIVAPAAASSLSRLLSAYGVASSYTELEEPCSRRIPCSAQARATSCVMGAFCASRSSPGMTAARCTTASGRCASRRSSNTPGTARSPSARPSATASCPAARSASQTCPPRNPRPPVTSPFTALDVRGLARLVPGDRALEPFVQLYLRLEPQRLARLADVRDPQLDVDVVQRLEDDVAAAARDALDALREVEDRHGRARVADVEALAGCLRALEAEQHRVHHVVDVAPGANLRAVAPHDEILACERRLDERANRAAADLSRPEDVERAHRHRGQAQLVVVRVRHVLACELRH